MHCGAPLVCLQIGCLQRISPRNSLGHSPLRQAPTWDTPLKLRQLFRVRGKESVLTPITSKKWCRFDRITALCQCFQYRLPQRSLPLLPQLKQIIAWSM